MTRPTNQNTHFTPNHEKIHMGKRKAPSFQCSAIHRRIAGTAADEAEATGLPFASSRDCPRACSSWSPPDCPPSSSSPHPHRRRSCRPSSSPRSACWVAETLRFSPLVLTGATSLPSKCLTECATEWSAWQLLGKSEWGRRKWWRFSLCWWGHT